MFDTEIVHLVIRILLAALMGGLIGLERSAGDRPACARMSSWRRVLHCS
jgi:putative Mg2+ transporter-C (MgtC) family protein